MSHPLCILEPMATAQLELIQSENNWKLDPQTIEVGRAGIAQARAALAGATRVRAQRADASAPARVVRADQQDQLAFPVLEQAAA